MAPYTAKKGVRGHGDEQSSSFASSSSSSFSSSSSSSTIHITCPHHHLDFPHQKIQPSGAINGTEQTRGFVRRNLTSPEANMFISMEADDEDDADKDDKDGDDDVAKDNGMVSSTQSPDIDGGWAWVVVAACFLQFVVSSGMYYSFSVFFVELLQTFGESRAKTGWIYSTNSAVHMFSGPLGGVVIVRWGPRAAVILGGLLAGLGYLLTAFAPDIDVVFITYGFINAVGTSLNFSGWIVGLSMFWKRHHAVVMGIAMSGSGCGVFLLGPFMESIVIHYGWRGAMLICAGLSFNFCAFGATIYNTKKQIEVPKILYEEGHSLMVDTGLSENSKDIDANLAINTEETLGSFDTLMCSRQWKGKKNFIESPCLTSQTIQGSSKSLKESCPVNDNWKRLQQWISSMRNFFRCKNFNCNLIPKESAEKEEIRQLLHSPTFWLLAASCFLSFMATTTLFAVFFDWVSWIEMSETFPLALAGSGAGDLVGRLLAGTLIGRGLPPLILFSGIQLLLASTIGCAALASTNIQLIASMVGFGIACGLQSVLYALMPSQLSSGVGMARVLGYLLLVTGAGALTGPPVAGLLVDLTESYNPVLILCTAAPAAAALFNFAAHFTAKYHKRTHQIYTSPTEQTSLHM